jgi:hypothetical protein
MDAGKTRQETSEEANIILNNLQNHGRDIWGLWGPPSKMFLLKSSESFRLKRIFQPLFFMWILVNGLLFHFSWGPLS